MPRAYVGIGSNVNQPVERVREAIGSLGVLGIVAGRSSLYRTAPWGGVAQPDFVNAVVALETQLSPYALLSELKALELRAGRAERGERWGPRSLDLDILAYGNLSLHTPDLTIPHPRLRERAFVLIPLAEIDPDYAAARDALPPGQIASVSKIEIATDRPERGESAANP